MGIFDLFKHTPQQPKQVNTVSFELAAHYRGFKAFPVTVHGNKDAEQNNQKLKDVSLPGHTITFSFFNDHAKVFIDSSQVGAIFDKDQIASIPLLTAVFARMDEENVITNGTTVKRCRIHLFVKYMEK